MSHKIEVGTIDPKVAILVSQLQVSIDGASNPDSISELTPSQIIAALDMVKLQYQLELFGLINA